MLARFGESRYLDEIGAELEHEDEFGQLYRARIPGDEDLSVQPRGHRSTIDTPCRFCVDGRIVRHYCPSIGSEDTESEAERGCSPEEQRP